MNIQSFSDYKVRIKYVPGFQDPYDFQCGEFLEDIDLKSIIYSALCNEDFLNAVNNFLNDNNKDKISLNTDINTLELSNIQVFQPMIGGNCDLKECGIPDTNHEGGFVFWFTLNSVDMEADWLCNINDVQGKNCIAKCDYIEICEGYLKFKLTM